MSDSYSEESTSEELKYFDTNIFGLIAQTGEIAPGAGTATSICLIPQDVSDTGRIGNRVVITSIEMLGNLWLSDVQNSAVYNIALVLDTRANGEYPDFTDIFATDTTDTHLNLENSDRFVILHRWFDTINQRLISPTSVYGRERIPLEYHCDCAIPIRYKSPTSTIGDIVTNNLFVAWNATSNDRISCTMNFRVRFVD